MHIEICDITICYGRSVKTIGEQLYGKEDISEDERTKKAQNVYDSVLTAFPKLRQLMITAQKKAHDLGYVETILGRRRHIPDMQLDPYEFVAMPGYVNPDIDPLDPNTLKNKSDIPERIVKSLKKEFEGYKYYGQIVKRTKQLYEEGIKVINNTSKIADASRRCVNCVDDETEILTLSGWKHESDVNVGDKIIGYDVDKQKVVVTSVTHKHVYCSDNDDFHVYEFNSPTFNAVSTEDHRWVVCESDEKPRFKTSQNIWKNKWPDYPILRVDDNNLPGNGLSDDYLKLLGWIMTDGHFSKSFYGIELYQSTRREKNALIYQSMIETLKKLNFDYNDRTDADGFYHEIYLKKNDMLYELWKYNPSRTLSFDFVSTLSQHQAQILMWSMIEGDGTLGYNKSNITFTCSNTERKDVFQYLAFVAGYATNAYKISAEDANRWTNGKMYDSVSNKESIVVRNDYWTISVLRVKRAHIYPHHKSERFINKVWCVTTGTGTWIMRRNGKVSITCNSIVQGSAAELTKMAILKLENDQRWKDIGGRLLIPVHDELICEVPMKYADEAGKLLSEIMSDAGSFLPFTISCDVTTTLRWYGLEYPCPYTEPKSLENMTEDEIKWVQYMLVESEYVLPVFTDENGEKARGNAAYGVNGKITDDMQNDIKDYMTKYNLKSDEEFLSHIKSKVLYG